MVTAQVEDREVVVQELELDLDLELNQELEVEVKVPKVVKLEEEAPQTTVL
jgi:hypothetical protein